MTATTRRVRAPRAAAVPSGVHPASPEAEAARAAIIAHVDASRAGLGWRAGLRPRVVVRAAATVVQSAAFAAVLVLCAVAATSPVGLAQVPSSYLFSWIIGFALGLAVVTALSRGHLASPVDVVLSLGVVVLLAGLLQLAVVDGDRFLAAAALLAAAVVAGWVRSWAREVDPADRSREHVLLAATVASSRVPVPPMWVLRTWSALRDGMLVDDVEALDAVIVAAEHAGTPVGAASLPGLPLPVRALAAAVPSRAPAAARSARMVAAAASPAGRAQAEAVAWHEAGHTVAAWLLPQVWTPVVVTIEAHDRHAQGVSTQRNTASWELGHRDARVADGLFAWAGKAAELLHDPAAQANGHASDTAHAEEAAAQLARLHCETWTPTAWRSAAVDLLAPHRGAVAALAGHLLTHGGAGPRDLARILGPRSATAELPPAPAMLQRRRSTNKKILAVFGVLVAGMLLLVGCVAVLGSVVASEEPEVRPTATAEPAATTTATQPPPPSEPTSPEPDTAAQVQAEIDARGGWGHWSDVVTGLSSTGSMVTVETALWNKPSNESDARFLCSFTATSSTDVPDVAFRVAASDGVSLATCQVP